MIRSEILGLSKMSEGEQRKLLASNGILKQTVQEFAGSEPRALVYYESLPDLADRLWREQNCGYPRRPLENAMRIIYGKDNPRDDTVSLDCVVFWFLFESLPIHRIQAALLAKEFQK